MDYASIVGGEYSTPSSAELTMFYVGNDMHLMEALKSGTEVFYKNAHIYTRSGTAPGHKQQIGFTNALSVASATINLARSAPALQNSLLLAVEPFVVELSPGLWVIVFRPIHYSSQSINRWNELLEWSFKINQAINRP